MPSQEMEPPDQDSVPPSPELTEEEKEQAENISRVIQMLQMMLLEVQCNGVKIESLAIVATGPEIAPSFSFAVGAGEEYQLLGAMVKAQHDLAQLIESHIEELRQ